LIVSGVAAWRILGLRAMPAVLALMAFRHCRFISPSTRSSTASSRSGQCSSVAVVENLQRPNSRGFLAAFALSLAAMVITKETPSLFISRVRPRRDNRVASAM